MTRQLLPPHYFYRCEQRPTLAWARKPFPQAGEGSARSVGIRAHRFGGRTWPHGSGRGPVRSGSGGRAPDDLPGRDRRGKRLFDGIDMRALGLADLKTVGDDGVIVQIYKPRD